MFYWVYFIRSSSVVFSTAIVVLLEVYSLSTYRVLAFTLAPMKRKKLKLLKSQIMKISLMLKNKQTNKQSHEGNNNLSIN